jgi:ribosomal protein S18 acetylase RimI-like enzyme
LIRSALYKDFESISGFDHIAHSEPSRLKFINRVIRSGQCYVVEHEKIIVGYGVIEYSFYDYGFVSMLYIHDAYRRQGFGTKIMKYFENICQTEKLFTSTNQSNKPMQTLLTKIGYQPSGIIENLDEGDPELVYFKKISVTQTR